MHMKYEKAFKDEEADERKEWLKQYNPNARTLIWIHRINITT